jgi:hypothetical protein
MCDCSSIHLQKIFFLRSIASGTLSLEKDRNGAPPSHYSDGACCSLLGPLRTHAIQVGHDLTVHCRRQPDQVASSERGRQRGVKNCGVSRYPQRSSHTTTRVFGVGILHARQTPVNFVTLEKSSRHCPVCGVFLSWMSTRHAAVPLEDATTGRTTPKTVMAC